MELVAKKNFIYFVISIQGQAFLHSFQFDVCIFMY
jgi:hypothetical protein